MKDTVSVRTKKPSYNSVLTVVGRALKIWNQKLVSLGKKSLGNGSLSLDLQKDPEYSQNNINEDQVATLEEIAYFFLVNEKELRNRL